MVRIVGALKRVQQICIRYSHVIAAFIAQRAAAVLEPGSASTQVRSVASQRVIRRS